MVLTFHHIILSPKEEGEASNKAHDRDVDADHGKGEDAIAILISTYKPQDGGEEVYSSLLIKKNVADMFVLV